VAQKKNKRGRGGQAVNGDRREHPKEQAIPPSKKGMSSFYSKERKRRIVKNKRIYDGVCREKRMTASKTFQQSRKGGRVVGKKDYVIIGKDHTKIVKG